MLITKEVEVQIGGKNAKYYESLGYIIPKKKHSKRDNVLVYDLSKLLLVKVEDLPKESHIELLINCDVCGKERFIPCREYNKFYKNKQYFCDDCKKIIKFNEFVINLENEGYEVLSTIDEYENCFSKIKYICNEHQDKGIQYINSATFNRGSGCKYCGYEKAADKNRTDFKTIINAFENKNLLLLINEDEYINGDQLLPFICYKHPEEDIQYIRYRAIYDGQGCKYCGHERIGELLRLKYDFVRLEFEKHNLILLADEHLHTNMLVPYKCKIHNDKIQYIRPRAVINENQGCPLCGIERMSGENSHLWKGGISHLTNYMRSKINQWKFDSLKFYNFKCCITGINDSNLVVHHLYSYTKILEDALLLLNIELKGEINNYTDQELKLIGDKFLELHYQKGLGKPMIKSLHKIFHSQIGKLIIDNGEFEEFKQKYYNFEFDDLLDNKYKYKNILSKVS